MNKWHLKNLQANALQLVVNQLLAVLIFYILSATLSKTEFGQLNFALAILLPAFTILSCGMDQLLVKKIAAAHRPQEALSLYAAHTLLSGLVFYLVLIGAYLLTDNPSTVFTLLVLIGVGKLMIYLSTPYKQAANGLEQFRLMAWLSVISNLTRCFILVVFMLGDELNLGSITLIFIVSDTIEFALGLYLFKRRTNIPFTIRWAPAAYRQLLRQALPQMGVVVITSVLARLDWILIGLMLSAASLAEYSFAYKVFEISLLPLLAIAPLLIPRFTKMFKQPHPEVSSLGLLARAEMIVAGLSIVVLNMGWAPVIDAVTQGKYGAVNNVTIFILSLCLPLLYMENFMWTIAFAQGRLKTILKAFIITLIVNVLADIILIPIYKNAGAAAGFLLACIAQVSFYFYANNLTAIKSLWQPLAVCTACGVLSLGCLYVFNIWLAIPLAILLYTVLISLCGQLKHYRRAPLQQRLSFK